MLALQKIQREKHGSTMKDKTVFGELTLRPTENSKTSNDCVAQGTRRTVGQSFTDGQESQTTEEILPLTTRMDMECQTLLPTEGTFPIQTAGATPDFRFRLLELHRTRTRTTTVLVLLRLLRLLRLWILVTWIREVIESRWMVDFNRFCCVRAEWI